MRALPALLALAALGLPPRAFALGPEWKHIRQAEKNIKDGEFLKAEAQLTDALALNKTEPKIYECKADVNMALDELPLARKNLKKAVELSRKKSLKFPKGSKGRLAWHKYVGELYSGIVEVTILENEKALRPRLLYGKPVPQKDFGLALGRVREAMNSVYPYGKFTSRIDDPLVRRAVDAAGGSLPTAPKAKAKPKKGEEAEEGLPPADESEVSGEEPSDDEAAAPGDEDAPAPKLAKKHSKKPSKLAKAPKKKAPEPAPEEEAAADPDASGSKAEAVHEDAPEMEPMSPIGGGGGGGAEGGGGGEGGEGGGEAPAGGGGGDSGGGDE